MRTLVGGNSGTEMTVLRFGRVLVTSGHLPPEVLNDSFHRTNGNVCGAARGGLTCPHLATRVNQIPVVLSCARNLRSVGTDRLHRRCYLD